MEPLLDELFRGEVYPLKEITPKYQHYKRVVQKIEKEMEAWEKRLSEEEYLELEALHELIYDSHAIELSEAFRQGVSVGTRFILEALDVKELLKPR